jgi:hypothetical protein
MPAALFRRFDRPAVISFILGGYSGLNGRLKGYDDDDSAVAVEAGRIPPYFAVPYILGHRSPASQVIFSPPIQTNTSKRWQVLQMMATIIDQAFTPR